MVTEPLGLDTMPYGVPLERRDDIALSYATGPERLLLLSPLYERAFGMPLSQLATSMNLAGAMNSVMPAINVFASAHDASRLYQPLCEGGAPVLEANTLADALKPAGPLVVDDLLPVAVRFSAGFKLGERAVSVFGLTPARRLRPKAWQGWRRSPMPSVWRCVRHRTPRLMRDGPTRIPPPDGRNPGSVR